MSPDKSPPQQRIPHYPATGARATNIGASVPAPTHRKCSYRETLTTTNSHIRTSLPGVSLGLIVDSRSLAWVAGTDSCGRTIDRYWMAPTLEIPIQCRPCGDRCSHRDAGTHRERERSTPTEIGADEEQGTPLEHGERLGHDSSRSSHFAQHLPPSIVIVRQPGHCSTLGRTEQPPE